MQIVPVIPESAPFTPEQRAWLNGFLAGLCSHVPAGQMPQSNGASANKGEPLLVLFGSQTGTAEGLAKKIAKESELRGFAPRVAALNDFESVGFASATKALIISSTWGDGHPPDNAASFWSWLSAEEAPRLEHLQFAVLGLGDRNYSDFCGASKKFDLRLATLGAKRLATRGECDVDYEEAAKSWIDSLWEKLTIGSIGITQNGRHTSASIATPERQSPSDGAPVKAAYGKSNPYAARLLKNLLLNKPGSAKEVRHYEIALNGSGLTYEAGDALGVIPVNCPELVDDILTTLQARSDDSVEYGESIMTLREALTHHLDITKPSSELLAAIGKSAPQSELALLLAPAKQAELRKWLWGRQVVDLLQLSPHPIRVAEFISLLKRMAPRLYSISSSPKAHPGEVHLTISAVRFESHGRVRKGVASTFLADRVGDTEFVKVFVQPSPGFKPPANGDHPMIMVGPGTGIAPFRAFLEEREVTGAKGRNWLFFGEQRRATDFLYEEKIRLWQQSGLLTELDLAFSRDQDHKIYVQDRMLERATELWSWLEAGACFYVCGDASQMAKDVDAALHKIVESAGGKSADDAKAYVAKMKSDKRYQRDVY